MNNLEQRIQTVKLQITQEEISEHFINILQEVYGLIKEYPTQESFVLLEYIFRKLSSITRDEPEQAFRLIMQQLLPWILTPDLPENAATTQRDCYQILQEWIDQYPDHIRQKLLQASLDRLVMALRLHPTRLICWIISTLGYRREDLVIELWKVAQLYDDELGDTALRTLGSLRIPGPDRQLLLNELHRRIVLRITLPLLGALSDLVDVTTISVITQSLKHLSSVNEDNVPFARTLALGILTEIANAYVTDNKIQKAIWDAIVSLYESDPDKYVGDICLGSKIVSRCNEPRVLQQLLQWLKYYVEDGEQSNHIRYLFYLRILECIRPQQLAGIPLSHIPTSLELLYQDAQQDTENTSYWATSTTYKKERAWDLLLYLGDSTALLNTTFQTAVVRETSGFVRKEIMDLLACFQWRSLPEQVITWITEPINLSKETGSQEFAFRRSAVNLSKSAETLQTFHALLNFGMTFDGEIPRETSEMLSSVALGLLKRNTPGIVEMLIDSIAKEKLERHRIVALQALFGIASSDLLPSKYQSQIVTILDEDERNDLERSYLVHILGSLTPESFTPELVMLLRHLAESGQPHTATSAIEALTHIRVLFKMPSLLEKYLPLYPVGDQWNCQAKRGMGYGTVSILCSLYTQNPHSFAPAIASLIEQGEGVAFSFVLRALNEVHVHQQHPLSEEVRHALDSRLTLIDQTMFDPSIELLKTYAHLLPDAFIEWPWERQWQRFSPETRRTLAEVLGWAKHLPLYAHQQRTNHLLRLTGDANYLVRRAVYRSLAQIAPNVLFQMAITWAHSPFMEWRRRAAEALAWVPLAEIYETITHQLLTIYLANDADPLVREAAANGRIALQRRKWSHEYLEVVRKAYGKNNKQRLLAWRYAHSLTQIGNDSVIAELQSDLDSKDLAPYERQWIHWMLKHLKEQWEKTIKGWPKSWFAWNGDFLYEQGCFSFEKLERIKGTFFLYPYEIEDNFDSCHWWGTFLAEKPIPVDQGIEGEILLTNSRQGNAKIVNQADEIIWHLDVYFD
ncbi:hypothetical protein KDW_06790 [Dictyobacter vulcani]|uniref:Uncharacterized protein n=1 Tax=Dictyobacter vulcani TaxID=2607529 RepID=A0A5J4KJB4_9CHLR|nr:HEAT repeat domain-containing protein [Dictyobacter vulcani]GER86517.1 hypothetical protein KDW_06790 [Dictyobacter vulcani]